MMEQWSEGQKTCAVHGGPDLKVIYDMFFDRHTHTGNQSRGGAQRGDMTGAEKCSE